MARVLNYTPHVVKSYRRNRPYRTYRSVGLARIFYDQTDPYALSALGDVNIVTASVGHLRLEPGAEAYLPRFGDYIIVSAITAIAGAFNLSDAYGCHVLTPGAAVKRRGVVVGCHGFRLWSSPCEPSSPRPEIVAPSPQTTRS